MEEDNKKKEERSTKTDTKSVRLSGEDAEQFANMLSQMFRQIHSSDKEEDTDGDKESK